MTLKLRHHVLVWGTFVFAGLGETLAWEYWLFFPLGVVLPWFVAVRLGVFEFQGQESRLTVNPILWARFVWFFAVEFYKANIDLLKILYGRGAVPKPAWVSARTKLKDGFGQVAVANFISLTPGTISWKIVPDALGAEICIHLLNSNAVDSLQPLVDQLDVTVGALLGEEIHS